MMKLAVALVVVTIAFVIGSTFIFMDAPVAVCAGDMPLCPTPTDTEVPPTETPTFTPEPPTETPTSTPTEKPTETPTNTPTVTPTTDPGTATFTPTTDPGTSTPTSTFVPSTSTPTNTIVPTFTSTSTDIPLTTPTSTDIPLTTPTKTSMPDKATETPFPPFAASASNKAVAYPGQLIGTMIADGLTFELYQGINAPDGSLMLPSYHKGAALYQHVVWMHRAWKDGWVHLKVGNVVVINDASYKVTETSYIGYGTYPVTNSGIQYIATCYADASGEWSGVQLYKVELIKERRR